MVMKRRNTRSLIEANKKRTRAATTAANTGSLPLDITVDILSRLPGQTLMLFRRVSKSWNKLLNDPVFINLHKEFNHSKEKILLMDDNYRHYSLDYQEPGKLMRIASPRFASSEKDGHRLRIVGSCDGLLYMEYCKPISGNSYSRRFYLWNPSTGKYKIVPCLKKWSREDEESNYFYYNPKSDDYEILSIMFWEVHDRSLPCGSDFLSTVAVYSLSKNYWRALPNIPYKILCTRTSGGQLLNGFIHWTAVRFDNGVSTCSSTLIAFEIGGDNFSEVSLPDKRIGLFGREIHLTEYRQKLCVLDIGDLGWDMWVMNEYGRGESWIKLHQIMDWDLPFCLTKNLLLLVKLSNGQGVLYEPENKRNEDCPIPIDIADACSYSESLIDPNGFRK